MNLYRTYRPKTLEDILGNEKTISTVDRMLNNLKKCPQVFLITGPTGCGKTTLGRIIRDRLEISDTDFIEMNSASFRGIDTVRDIIKQSQYAPMKGDKRGWLIDECHKLTSDAQEAFLKLLEDTPSHVYIILCTTDPQKLKNTLTGRCSVLPMSPLKEEDMFRLLKKIVKNEGERIPKAVYDQIILDSQGHSRNAINILEQVLIAEPDVRLEVVKQTAEEQSQAIELCRALLSGKGWKAVQTILRGIRDQDPEGVRRLVLSYNQSVLLKGDDLKAGLILEEFEEPFYNSGFPGLVRACYSIVKN